MGLPQIRQSCPTQSLGNGSIATMRCGAFPIGSTDTATPYMEGEGAKKHGAGPPISGQQHQDTSFNSTDMAKWLPGP